MQNTSEWIDEVLAEVPRWNEAGTKEKAKQQILDRIAAERAEAIREHKETNREAQKSMCGCPMCTFHTDAYALAQSKPKEKA